jgi:hypothetical protein
MIPQLLLVSHLARTDLPVWLKYVWYNSSTTTILRHKPLVGSQISIITGQWSHDAFT